MKIALFHNLPSGGGKRALYHHVRGMVQRGHVLEGWCLSTADQWFLPLNTLITEHVLPCEWKPRGSTSDLWRSTAEYREAMRRIRAVHDASRRAAGQIDQAPFDLVLAGACRFFGASAIARYTGVPTVHYLGEPYRPLYEAMPALPWIAPTFPRRYPVRGFRYARGVMSDALRVKALRIQAREELANVRACASILVNSRFSRESLLRAFGVESRVCYLGVDTDQFRPIGVPRDRVVLGLGGVYHGKGIDRAIRALASIDAPRRPPLVWIANFSDHEYQSAMERLAWDAQVALTFRLAIPDAQLVDEINRAAVLLYTSRLEPFGFAPLEAGACETPVVAVAEGGVRETIEDGLNGLLVDDDEPGALGRAVLRLIDQPAFAADMGRRARQRVVEHWTWARALDRLEACCQDICERHARRADAC